MYWPLSKKKEVSPQLYEAVLQDVLAWYLAEVKARPLDKQIINGVQTNALVNFITFDLHALIKTQGFVHMQELLQARNTQQTVMLRLKDLVLKLYVKYGETEIDELRSRIYRSIDSIYGLTFRSEDMDTNSTFWLWPFFKQIYDSIPLTV